MSFFSTYVSVPALGNINVKMHGNFGYQDIIMDNPLPGGKAMTTFMNPNISVGDALDGFSTGNNRVTGDVNITLFSGGFKKWGGYNTVELNAKAGFGTSLPYGLFEFAKEIGNKNYDIGDININAQSYAELAFGHSRQITDKLRLGAKFKLLFGIARADFKFEDVKAVNRAGSFELDGFHDVAVTRDRGGEKLSDKSDRYSDQITDFVNLKDEGDKGGRTTGIGATLNLGAEYTLPVYPFVL